MQDVHNRKPEGEGAMETLLSAQFSCNLKLLPQNKDYEFFQSQTMSIIKKIYNNNPKA